MQTNPVIEHEKTLYGPRVRVISSVGQVKFCGGKYLSKSEVLSSEWKTERVSIVSCSKLTAFLLPVSKVTTLQWGTMCWLLLLLLLLSLLLTYAFVLYYVRGTTNVGCTCVLEIMCIVSLFCSRWCLHPFIYSVPAAATALREVIMAKISICAILFLIFHVLCSWTELKKQLLRSVIYRWLAVNWIDCVGYWQAVTWPVLWHPVAYSYLTHWCLYVRVWSYLLFIPCFHDMPAAYFYHCDRFCIRRAERMCRCETTEMCRMGLKSFCGFFKWMLQISLIWLD